MTLHRKLLFAAWLVEYAEDASDHLLFLLTEIVAEWMTVYFGERCDPFAPEDGCGCCEGWQAFDNLFGKSCEVAVEVDPESLDAYAAKMDAYAAKTVEYQL